MKVSKLGRSTTSGIIGLQCDLRSASSGLLWYISCFVKSVDIEQLLLLLLLPLRRSEFRGSGVLLLQDREVHPSLMTIFDGASPFLQVG